MKKISFFVLICMVALAIVSCGEKKVEQGNPEADSLRNVISQNMAEMDEMNLFLDAINVSMDSVVNMESDILRTSGEKGASKKEQIKQNIKAYKNILERQRERLAILEKKLKDGEAVSKSNAQKMLQTIEALRQQIEEKDQAIAQLSAELDKRNFDIETLKTNVEKLNTNVAQLTEENTQKDKTIEAQTDQMNEAYVFVGDKKQLKEAGLLTGGSLFKKSKLDMSQANASAFKKIDMRTTKSISIPGKKPQILTQVPAGSYTIAENSNGTCTLTITDPAKFWSITNYLIIRY